MFLPSPRVLRLLVATFLALGVGRQPAKARPPGVRPNIIFVLIDDQRYDFLSFLGHPWIKTPNIDRLASNAAYFENAFVTTSLCSPSRASILTGQYAHTHKVVDNDTELPAGTPTFPQELQKQGYQTAFIGKWHMGGSNAQPRPGFNRWVSFRGQGDYTNPVLNIDGQDVSREGYTPDILTTEAVEYIKDKTARDEAYCLYLSHKSIHEPFTPAPRHLGRYQRLEVPRPETYADTAANYAGKPLWLKRQRRSWHGAERDFSINGYGNFDRFFQAYSECMLGIDDSVGQIVRTLEELGSLESTVIIYFSDNGYLMGEHGLIDKRVMYEESIRVPCFVHYPHLIKAASTRPEFILNLDIGPTILDLAGAEIPPTMHGKSFLPLLRNETIEWRQDFVYEYFIDSNTPQTPTIFGLRTNDYSYMTYRGVWDMDELYDMQRDPRQINNLLGGVNHGQDYGPFLKSARTQKPAVAKTLSTLHARLEALLLQYGGSMTPTWQAD